MRRRCPRWREARSRVPAKPDLAPGLATTLRGRVVAGKDKVQLALIARQNRNRLLHLFSTPTTHLAPHPEHQQRQHKNHHCQQRKSMLPRQPCRYIHDLRSVPDRQHRSNCCSESTAPQTPTAETNQPSSRTPPEANTKSFHGVGGGKIEGIIIAKNSCFSNRSRNCSYRTRLMRFIRKSSPPALPRRNGTRPPSAEPTATASTYR